MTKVETRTIGGDDADLRLDRWFRKHYPHLSHGRLEKLLRTGQVRVDGGRVKAAQRLLAGQTVRVPPLGDLQAEAKPAIKKPPRVDERVLSDLRERILYMDRDVLVLDKPAGLAVQGGTGTATHIDAMLDGLILDGKERPRLVHRLDKDTSGVLVLARTAAAARFLAAAFKGREVAKLYWAAVVGVPKVRDGRISAPLIKLPGTAGDKVMVDEDFGRPAKTLYRTVDTAGRRAAWLALEPLTGRTHQIRVHCAGVLGTPIVGDGKYGGAEAFALGPALSGKLHLHARGLRLPSLAGKGRFLEFRAPLPEHMRATWEFLGFDPAMISGDDGADAFLSQMDE